MNNEYQKYESQITALCNEYFLDRCDVCPLFMPCTQEKEDLETHWEFNKRREAEIAEAYKRWSLKYKE